MPQWEMNFSSIATQGGWAQTARTTDMIVYTRRFYPTWVFVVCILLFPIGLLALLAEKKQTNLTATFSPYGAGTIVKLSGQVSEKTKGWLDGFAQTLNDKARAAAAHSGPIDPATG